MFVTLVLAQLIFSIPESVLRELIPVLVNTSSASFGEQLQAMAKESPETIAKLVYFAKEVSPSPLPPPSPPYSAEYMSRSPIVHKSCFQAVYDRHAALYGRVTVCKGLLGLSAASGEESAPLKQSEGL